MKAQHLTLTANTVATVSWTEYYKHIEVVNLSGSAEIYATTDGSTPSVGGADTIVLPAVINGIEINNDWANVGGSVGSPRTVVKLISAGTPRVAVRAW